MTAVLHAAARSLKRWNNVASRHFERSVTGSGNLFLLLQEGGTTPKLEIVNTWCVLLHSAFDVGFLASFDVFARHRYGV
jgi:hypothetical protein